jgi:glycosyltransferase involved in cell wall biosynthesis
MLSPLITSARVVCIMPSTPERAALRAKAIACLKAQTYPNVKLSVGHFPNISIGESRNRLIEAAPTADIVIHWDDDDYSHPDRIAEQVDRLQVSQADITGYSDMLFWRDDHSEAWLYDGSLVGTSLCYWRTFWAGHRFESTNNGEDTRFVACARYIRKCTTFGPLREVGDPVTPRMIARIHAGNTNREFYRREVMQAVERQGGEWKRMADWDEYCRKIMEAK